MRGDLTSATIFTARITRIDLTGRVYTQEFNHPSMPLVHIAVEGCCHGELDAIYSTIEYIQTEKSTPIELLLVCGDFECIRDSVDLACVAVPSKYRKLVSTLLPVPRAGQTHCVH